MHRRASDPRRDRVPPRAWHATGVPQHGGVGGRSSSCLGGSLLVQPTVQVHGNCHGCNLGVARCKSAPLNLTFPPSPSQNGFGSQPSTPSASAGRAGWAQGRKLTSRELQVLLGAAAAPRAPPGCPSPISRHREEAAQQCWGTHLQGSDSGCHPTRHACVGPDFFQDLVETALQEATTQVRMARGGDIPSARAQHPPKREVLLLQPRAHSHGEGLRLQGQLSHFSDQILGGERGKEGKKQGNSPKRQNGAWVHAQHQACHSIPFRTRAM